MPDVASLRGLAFLRPVHIATTTRSDYGASIQKQISQSFSSEELEGLSKEYAQMGFLTEADTPLIKILIDYYSGFPAAYYVPGTDSLYVLTDDGRDSTTLSIIIAHELTHALQDQHLDMRPTIFPSYSHYSSDAQLAQTSLIEGDATYLQHAYDAEKTYFMTASAAFDSARVLAQAYKSIFLLANYQPDGPLFLDAKGYYPYYIGEPYVAYLYSKSGGWSNVNDLYSITSVPRSSAEINRVEQNAVAYFELNGVENLLVSQAQSITFADDDNAGFALLLGLFYGALDSVRLGRSLDWSGDRYTFVKRLGQTYGTLVWAMAFTNADGARYLFHKTDSLLRGRRLGGLAAATDSLPDSTGAAVTYTYTTSLDTAYVRLAGNQLWWLENTGALTARIMADLATQQKTHGIARAAYATEISINLSAEAKRMALKSLLRYLFRR